MIFRVLTIPGKFYGLEICCSLQVYLEVEPLGSQLGEKAVKANGAACANPTQRVLPHSMMYIICQSGPGGPWAMHKHNQLIEVQYNDVNTQCTNMTSSMKLHNT